MSYYFVNYTGNIKAMEYKSDKYIDLFKLKKTIFPSQLIFKI